MVQDMQVVANVNTSHRAKIVSVLTKSKRVNREIVHDLFCNRRTQM